LLQNACDNILDNLKPIIENRDDGSHKAYLSMWKALKQEDDELALMFDDLKRSTAFFKLTAWRNRGILSDKEFSQFSIETRNMVNIINSA